MFSTFQIPEQSPPSGHDETSPAASGASGGTGGGGGGSAGGGGGGGAASSSTGPQRRASRKTTQACAECKRRKIACDGTVPCGSCRWYKHPELCHYPQPRQKTVLSWKLVDKLSNSLVEAQGILERLFPGSRLDSLAPLSREALIDLIHLGPSPSSAYTATGSTGEGGVSSHGVIGTGGSATSPNETEDGRTLGLLEETPNHEFEWDESTRADRDGRDRIDVADDVNALSLSEDRRSSYLGVSSVTAALRVILKLAPGSGIGTSQSTSATPYRSLHSSPPQQASRSASPTDEPTPEEGTKLINAYFSYVHPFVPMLDEAKFRSTYALGKRRDSPWLGLLNIVFAMGSIAATKSHATAHAKYYDIAKSHLGLDSFGNGHLETVQALAIMGGYYLHYRNRPNMASAIMGAAFRMACALGLHREFEEAPPSVTGGMENERTRVLHREFRRRTWWTIFCLDTWGSTTLGRPSLGGSGNAITVQCPRNIDDATGTLLPSTKPTHLTPLISALDFCKIAQRIQDRFATSPLLTYDEILTLDTLLLRWHEHLPPALLPPNPCPSSLLIPRSAMKWRYQNLRMILYRPILLAAALRTRTPGSGAQALTENELAAVAACRTIAGEAIRAIGAEWLPNQMSGWNAVWFLFQASLIPLVSLMMVAAEAPAQQQQQQGAQGARQRTKEEQALILDWQSQIDLALTLFEAMTDWSVTAKRSREVVARIYSASKTILSAQPPVQQLQDPFQYPPGGFGGGGFDSGNNGATLDDLWDKMMWESFSDAPELGAFGGPNPFDDVSNSMFWEEMALNL